MAHAWQQTADARCTKKFSFSNPCKSFIFSSTAVLLASICACDFKCLLLLTMSFRHRFLLVFLFAQEGILLVQHLLQCVNLEVQLIIGLGFSLLPCSCVLPPFQRGASCHVCPRVCHFPGILWCFRRITGLPSEARVCRERGKLSTSAFSEPNKTTLSARNPKSLLPLRRWSRRKDGRAVKLAALRSLQGRIRRGAFWRCVRALHLGPSPCISTRWSCCVRTCPSCICTRIESSQIAVRATPGRALSAIIRRPVRVDHPLSDAHASSECRDYPLGPTNFPRPEVTRGAIRYQSCSQKIACVTSSQH